MHRLAIVLWFKFFVFFFLILEYTGQEKSRLPHLVIEYGFEIAWFKILWLVGGSCG